MPIFERTNKKLIIKIDDFLGNIEIGTLIFKEGIKAYLKNDTEAFMNHLAKIEKLEGQADKLQRSIENDMIIHSILPQHRSEVVQLLDKLDEMLDAAKASLNEFYVEAPKIPVEIHNDIISLTESSVNAAEEAVPAARSYFSDPYNVRNRLLKVYFYERETDKATYALKKKIFHDMNDLHLAEKAHLRYIIHHIESISDRAQDAADLLASMSMRLIM